MTLLPELLEHQNLLLDSLLTLLEEEFNFLKQRQVSELPEIANQKQQLLEQLQQQDHQISQHPDRDALKDELSPLKEMLVEKLRDCQEKNEVNGKLNEALEVYIDYVSPDFVIKITKTKEDDSIVVVLPEKASKKQKKEDSKD